MLITRTHPEHTSCLDVFGFEVADDRFDVSLGLGGRSRRGSLPVSEKGDVVITRKGPEVRPHVLIVALAINVHNTPVAVGQHHPVVGCNSERHKWGGDGY